MGLKPSTPMLPWLQHSISPFLPGAQAKGLLKEPDRLRHVFVLDVLKNFFETLDQTASTSLRDGIRLISRSFSWAVFENRKSPEQGKALATPRSQA